MTQLQVKLKIMAESVSSSSTRKLVRIDISSDNLCPWCYVGKINLDKAIAASKHQFDFEVFFLYTIPLAQVQLKSRS